MFTTKIIPIAFRIRPVAGSTIARTRIYCRVQQAREYSTPADLPVPNKKKVWVSAEEAIEGDVIKSGDTLLCAGAFYA
jgi:hypothetical protein